MKRTIALAIALAALAGIAETQAEKYAKYTKARRYCVSRTMIENNTKCVTVWHRDGRPDWILPAVETNALRVIAGKEQNNALQSQIEKLDDSIAELNRRVAKQLEALLAASNRYVTAETRIANAKSGLEGKKTEYEQKRDSATLPTTKAIYQAFIDVIDGILAKFDAVLNKED